MNRFQTIAVTAIAALVLAACGSAASGSPSAGGAASQPASHAAQASVGGPGPSFTAGAVADLEAMLPGTVAGVTITKASMQGNQYLVSSGADAATKKFLEDLGVSPNDVSMATGFGFSTSGSTSTAIVMFAFRAAGADSNRLVAAFKTANDANGSSPLSWSSTNLGGKSVEKSSSGGQDIYLYVKGDVLFFISATSITIADEILSKLP